MRHTRFVIALIPLLSACSGIFEPTAGGSRSGETPSTPLPAPTTGLPPAGGPAVLDDGYRTPDLRLPPLPPPEVAPPPRPPAPPPPAILPPPGNTNQPSFNEVAPGAPSALPISGGTLLVLRDGKIAVAADPDRSRLFVADVAQATLVREIVLPPGSEPGRLIEDAAGRVSVVLRASGQLLTLAPGTLRHRRAAVLSARRRAVWRPAPTAAGCTSPARAGSWSPFRPPVARPCGPASWSATCATSCWMPTASTLLVSTFRTARVLKVDLEGNPAGELAPPVSLNLTRRSRARLPEGPAGTRFTPSVARRTLAAAARWGGHAPPARVHRRDRGRRDHRGGQRRLRRGWLRRRDRADRRQRDRRPVRPAPGGARDWRRGAGGRRRAVGRRQPAGPGRAGRRVFSHSRQPGPARSAGRADHRRRQRVHLCHRGLLPGPWCCPHAQPPTRPHAHERRGGGGRVRRTEAPGRAVSPAGRPDHPAAGPAHLPVGGEPRPRGPRRLPCQQRRRHRLRLLPPRGRRRRPHLALCRPGAPPDTVAARRGWPDAAAALGRGPARHRPPRPRGLHRAHGQDPR